VHWAPGIPHALDFQGEEFEQDSGASRRGNNFRRCRPGQARREPGPITTEARCYAELEPQSLLQLASVVMGPRLRGDDELRLLREPSPLPQAGEGEAVPFPS